MRGGGRMNVYLKESPGIQRAEGGWCIYIGNRKGLEALFSKGAASPHDVGSVYGLTPLHIALFKRNFALCEFLLTAGADPYLNTGMRRCVIDIVREDILRQQLSLDEIVYLKRLFVDVDDLGSFNFTAVHKAALGLSPLSLESLLQTSTSLIDAQDSQGRTALLWAASSSNVHATAVLLRHGASPHIATRTGQSPLHHAVEYGSPQCARLLLAAGAAVDHPNRRGRTPLHYASRLADNAAMCRLLLDGGADVRVRDRGLSTPLHEAVQYDRQPQIRALVDAGADLLALDADGRTPLDLAQDHSDPALDASTRCSNNPVHNERQLNSCLEDSPMAIDQDDFSSSSSSPSSAAEPPPSSSIPLQGTCIRE
ncbi:hypothetical protein ASPZODRAFT_2089317 [Penicilliopsis zonata CBS 506.65]|uniref:Uncharacterized protein n=1 Tax=Penicilliopsis zonata CBS 506.65 TaxID=1073090 RepID=A0A1L9SGG6_9EURO|nr:hypothetical protein ASPZODRAFT_2089317 [Penicilliopsis zonata CBS 506.65]OJJ46261.1 hypothetical protein ASPZODRAFT_2089317 [Penicilliopsis zonata CBS 506.65]